MRSYAHERERIGPLPYLVQAAPGRPRAAIPLKAYAWAVALAVPAWIGVFELVKLGMTL